ncbi:PAS domain S-box protein [Sphingobacterium thalpophilum]|uniref:PAS domain S-box protein n=1 Tax=Sphingobacterium thalpophilum TaxID=259 RepID=UPI0024A6F391|nr:PAS domain S-box protein [Sphingobacterium thalpophilum]
MSELTHLEIQEIYDLNNIPVLCIDEKGIIIFSNRAATTLLAADIGGLSGRPVLSFFYGEDSGQAFQQIFAGIPVINSEVLLQTNTGGECWALLSCHIIQDTDGLRLTYLFFQDITALKKQASLTAQRNSQMEQQLYESREHQARLAAIVSTSDDAIVSKNLEGIITSWNVAAEMMFGYSEREALGRHISLIIPADRLAEEDHIIENIKQGRQIDHFETVRMHKGGRLIPVSLSISPMIDESGVIMGASKIARDISRQKEYEKNLQRYTNHVETLNTIGRLVSESLEVGEILQRVIDASTKIIGASFGFFIYNRPDKFQGQALQAKCSGISEMLFDKLRSGPELLLITGNITFAEIIRSENITNDAYYRQNDWLRFTFMDELQTVSCLIVPVISASGTVIGRLIYGHREECFFSEAHEKLIVGIATLSSTALENANLYEEIRSLNIKKDEFIGLASHELKTPITSLKGFLQLISMRMLEGDVNRSAIDRALSQANKLSALVGDMLDASKIQTGQLPLIQSPFDLVGMIKDTVEQIQYTSSSHHIAFFSEKTIHRIIGDKRRLEQVIINLVNNAIKYSPEADLVKLFLKEEPGYAVLRVQDFGIGIPEDQRERIFSRFYRASGIDTNISGLGIGLYIAKEIVDKHYGTLSVESELGQGSTFTVKLPV